MTPRPRVGPMRATGNRRVSNARTGPVLLAWARIGRILEPMKPDGVLSSHRVLGSGSGWHPYLWRHWTCPFCHCPCRRDPFSIRGDATADPHAGKFGSEMAGSPPGCPLGRARGCPSATAAEISLQATSCLASVSLSGTLNPSAPKLSCLQTQTTLLHRSLPSRVISIVLQNDETLWNHENCPFETGD
jgi:hypothetical protein